MRLPHLFVDAPLKFIHAGLVCKSRALGFPGNRQRYPARDSPHFFERRIKRRRFVIDDGRLFTQGERGSSKHFVSDSASARGQHSQTNSREDKRIVALSNSKCFSIDRDRSEWATGGYQRAATGPIQYLSRSRL